VLTMMYKVASGTVQEERYGIKLARAIGFPDTFIETAERVAKELKAKAEANKANAQARKLAERRRLILSLREKLLQADQSDLNEVDLARYLKKLQSEFIERMALLESRATPAPGDGERVVLESIEIDDGIDDEERTEVRTPSSALSVERLRADAMNADSTPVPAVEPAVRVNALHAGCQEKHVSKWTV